MNNILAVLPLMASYFRQLRLQNKPKTFIHTSKVHSLYDAPIVKILFQLDLTVKGRLCS